MKPFRFTDERRQEFKARLEGRAHAGRFISDLQRIVGNHLQLGTAGDFPAAKVLQDNARAIRNAALKFTECLGQLGEAEKAILGQYMWLADKYAYNPSGGSVDRVIESTKVMERAAQNLVRAGKNGRPSLRLEGLIREVHASYVTHFKVTPKIDLKKTNDFAVALKLCLKEVRRIDKAPEVPRLLEQMRSALGG